MRQPRMREEILGLDAQHAPQHFHCFRPAFCGEERAAQLFISAQILGLRLEDMPRMSDDLIVALISGQAGDLVLIFPQAEFRHDDPALRICWANQEAL